MKTKTNKNSHSRIDKTAMREAVERSGYLMEQRVLPILEAAGYLVEANPVYPDPYTGKSREYDFSALNMYNALREEYDYLVVHLNGECVNNRHPMVFFESHTEPSFLYVDDLKCSGIPLYLPDADDQHLVGSVQENFSFEEFHHYCRGVYSRQFCTFQQKKDKSKEWMAWHSDELHGAFNSLILATEYGMSRSFSNWEPPVKKENGCLLLNLHYPLMIVRDDLYSCRQQHKGPVYRKCDHIQFRKPVPYANHQVTYHIDVLKESYLPRYLQILHDEHNEVVRRLNGEAATVRAGIEAIIAKAQKQKRERPDSGYRDVLDYDDY